MSNSELNIKVWKKSKKKSKIRKNWKKIETNYYNIWTKSFIVQNWIFFLSYLIWNTGQVWLTLSLVVGIVACRLSRTRYHCAKRDSEFYNHFSGRVSTSQSSLLCRSIIFPSVNLFRKYSRGARWEAQLCNCSWHHSVVDDVSSLMSKNGIRIFFEHVDRDKKNRNLKNLRNFWKQAKLWWREQVGILFRDYLWYQMWMGVGRRPVHSQTRHHSSEFFGYFRS